MKSILLSTVTRFVTPFLLVLSVFLLLRGHNEPGGGFAGGLVAAAAFALHMFAFGAQSMRDAIKADPRALSGVGLVIAVLSGLPAMLIGKPFLTGIWGTLPTPFGGAKLGTPLLFDVGVYLVVIGIVVSFLEDFKDE